MATITAAAASAMCDALVDLLDVGVAVANPYIQLETSGDVEVATITLTGATAFGNASSGVATVISMGDDTNATGGTVAQASFYNQDNTKILECTVGTSGAEINLSSLAIGAGDTVSLSTLTITQPTT